VDLALAALRNVTLFLVVAALLLVPLHLFLVLRLRRAIARGEERRYDPLADPWIPVVELASGAVMVAVLRLLG
jgi:hypothetical protein